MKGKGSFRFDAPNIGRLRNRVANPTQELTSQLREQLQVIAAKVLNANTLQIKAELISFVVNELGLEFETPEKRAQVTDLTNSIFDTYFAATPEALEALTGKLASSDDETDSPEPKAAKPSKAKAKAEKAEAEKAEAEQAQEDEAVAETETETTEDAPAEEKAGEDFD